MLSSYIDTYIHTSIHVNIYVVSEVNVHYHFVLLDLFFSYIQSIWLLCVFSKRCLLIVSIAFSNDIHRRTCFHQFYWFFCSKRDIEQWKFIENKRFYIQNNFQREMPLTPGLWWELNSREQPISENVESIWVFSREIQWLKQNYKT